jgi:hypothetical protein
MLPKDSYGTSTTDTHAVHWVATMLGVAAIGNRYGQWTGNGTA